MITTDQASVSGQPRARTDGDYADVVTMLQELAQMPAQSPERCRQRARIVARCLPIADDVARHFSCRGEPFDDLVQVARLGLLKAVDRFDVPRGSTFVPFAVATMTGEVRRHFRNYTWAMHVPRPVKELHVKVGRARQQLTLELKRAPRAEELATAMGISQETLMKALLCAEVYRLRSIDAVVASDGDGLSLIEAAAAGAEDEGIERVIDREALRLLLAGLDLRERQLLQMRFVERMTMVEIAQRFGVSRISASRSVARTLNRLRERLGEAW